jgi:ATP-dependent DNA helicase RecQ
VAAYLNARGLSTAAYHAGFEPAERKTLERGFLDNGFERIVATNALGMGIDKPDLRAVLHFDLPGSITAYYQEMGRAGRDGLPSTCVLLFDANDARVQEHFIETAQPDRAAFEGIMRALDEVPLQRLTELKVATGLHSTLLNVVLAELIEQGYVEKIEHEKRQAYRSLGRSLQALDLSRYERQGTTRRGELKAMLAYGRQNAGCYMVTLCAALGDTALPPCGKCAACKQQPSRLIPDVSSARAWLDRRTAVIPAGARSGHLPGVAVIDGGDFSLEATEVLGRRDVLSQPELRARLDYALDALAQVDAVVLVPSLRWTKRIEHGEYMAKRLDVPLLADAVSWKEAPAAAQPDLQNDEQRRSNVQSKMTAVQVKGARVLLVDDAVASLATMREAVRALRAANKQDLTVTPFALVKTRW